MKESIRLKASTMKELNDISMKGEIVVFGSTYMSGFPLYELLNKCSLENAVYNRSMEGLTIREALLVVGDCVINIRPSKLFLALGEEDEDDPEAASRYKALVSTIHTALPDCELFLIGLTEQTSYAESFNRAARALCDGKRIRFIDFVSKSVSDTALYKARFKQLSCFFRSKPLTSLDAFAIASL